MGRDIRDLIIDDPMQGIFRVHRSAMTSDEIFELEQQRVLDRCWLYVGHESEIPTPGDYKRRQVGGRPIMFVRGSDNQIRVLLNTCPHRGALVCRQDEGNANIFQCFYHAWTFNNKGELIGTPEEEGYALGFDRSERSMSPPPKFDNYRGMYFLSYNPSIVDLSTYLGDVRVFLDIFIDQGEGAGIRVLPGSFKSRVKANWKLMVENAADHYHAVPTHFTWIQYLRSVGRGLPMDRAGFFAHPMALGGGHVASVSVRKETDAGWFFGQRVNPRFSRDAIERVDKMRTRLVDRYGPEFARWDPAGGGARGNFLVYPNLVIGHGFKYIRVLWPTSPDSFDLQMWITAPRNLTVEEIREINNSELLDAQGPGGFQAPDDYEALESCQMGFAARELEWSDISRGMHRLPEPDDELFMRIFWRQWHADMQGLPEAARGGDDWESLEAFQSAGVASGFAAIT